jgi:hypothetical protein
VSGSIKVTNLSRHIVASAKFSLHFIFRLETSLQDTKHASIRGASLYFSRVLKMATKMTTDSIVLGLLAAILLAKGCQAEEPWTPADFDWSTLTVAPREKWGGLYHNLTTNPREAKSALMQIGEPGTINDHAVLFVSFAIGLAWQAANIASAAAGIAFAVKGCITNDGSAGAIAGCAFGIAGTALSIGSAFKAAQASGWFARAATTWDNSGLELINLSVFDKRCQDTTQPSHEALLSDVLRRAGLGKEPELIGYAPAGHRLAGRDNEHLHPRAPIFRFVHPKHGLLDIASRQAVNGTRFTLSYVDEKLERRNRKRQSFQHERLSDHVMEARFDGPAVAADPSNPDFDAAGGFQEIEDQIQCYSAGGLWQSNAILSAQMFDNTAMATFGFASLGIFENNDQDAALQAFTPMGMPLAVPAC